MIDCQLVQFLQSNVVALLDLIHPENKTESGGISFPAISF